MLQPFKAALAEKGIVSFSVRARPGSPRSRIVFVMDDGSVKIDLAAPAEEGKANAELIHFLAKEFGVSSSGVEVLVGGGGRRKIVRIRT